MTCHHPTVAVAAVEYADATKGAEIKSIERLK